MKFAQVFIVPSDILNVQAVIAQLASKPSNSQVICVQAILPDISGAEELPHPPA